MYACVCTVYVHECICLPVYVCLFLSVHMLECVFLFVRARVLLSVCVWVLAHEAGLIRIKHANICFCVCPAALLPSDRQAPAHSPKANTTIFTTIWSSSEPDEQRRQKLGHIRK